MKSGLPGLIKTWEVLGKEDPLWAIFSDPEKRGGRWDLREFMETGEQNVAQYYELITRHAHTSGTFSHVLDFGCGVGRLTFPWAKRAKRVTGVDISSGMLQIANDNLAGREHIEFVLNQNDDLRVFKGGEFDLVFSLVCLQHMPWPLAVSYIAEFSRICTAGGVVAFQLPTRTLQANRMATFRKSLIEFLPFGIGQHYRRWRHGSSAVFDVFYTPSSVVEATAATAGLKLLHREPDPAAGPTTEGFFYIFAKAVLRMPVIGIDTNGLYTAQAGVARYIRGLLRGLKRVAAPDVELLPVAWEVENFLYRQPQRAFKTIYRELIWAKFNAPRHLRKTQRGAASFDRRDR